MAGAISDLYDFIVFSLPEQFRIIPPLILFALMLAAYGIFIWLFYRFLAKRDLLPITLKKYNVFEHSFFVKFFAVLFYFLEFAILIPFVITIWFAFLSAILIILMKDQPVSTVLFISAVLIGAVRITSYFKEDLSKDMAKLFPLTLLTAAVLAPDFFKASNILPRFYQIPSLFSVIFYYAIFIAALEIVLRIFYIAYKSIASRGDDLGLDADYISVEEISI